jgi:hypothetical protein
MRAPVSKDGHRHCACFHPSRRSALRHSRRFASAFFTLRTAAEGRLWLLRMTFLFVARTFSTGTATDRRGDIRVKVGHRRVHALAP